MHIRSAVVVAAAVLACTGCEMSDDRRIPHRRSVDIRFNRIRTKTLRHRCDLRGRHHPHDSIHHRRATGCRADADSATVGGDVR